LKRAERHRWNQEPLNSTWQHINEVTALNKKLTAKNAIEQRNLRILAH